MTGKLGLLRGGGVYRGLYYIRSKGKSVKLP